MKTFREELIELMLKHSKTEDYTNPWLISGICAALENTGVEVPDELWDWGKDNWEK